MKATLKNYRQSPRKVRLVADVLRGRLVTDALNMLRAINKKVADPIRKLIVSVTVAAEQKGKDVAALKIGSITVDQGMTMKRYRPRAFGKSAPIRKRSSTIRVELH